MADVPGVLDHLAALVRIPSVSSLSNRPVIDYARNVLAGAGWQAREYCYHDAAGVEKVNLMGAPAQEAPDERDLGLVLVCHTDTVPYSADWQAALQPTEAGGLLHGCGACDVKGFLACLLTAVASLPVGAVASGTRILLTADEEIGCVGATRLLAAHSFHVRRMIVGEPTSLHAARAGKGYALAEFTVHGREAHSALPENGISAIYSAARLIMSIEEYAKTLQARQNAIFAPPFTTLNIGTIQGGTAKNVIPGTCRFLLEWRPIAGQDPHSVYEEVTRIANEIAEQDTDFRFTSTVLRTQLGFETPASSALVRTLSGLTGKEPTSIAFGSEASIFAPIADEVVVFGPGDMNTAHSDRECVPIDELHEAVRCVAALLSDTANS